MFDRSFGFFKIIFKKYLITQYNSRISGHQTHSGKNAASPHLPREAPSCSSPFSLCLPLAFFPSQAQLWGLPPPTSHPLSYLPPSILILCI